MATPRIRRLTKEYSEMSNLSRESSLLVFSAESSIPLDYEVILHCGGLCLYDGRVTYIDEHRFDIHLGPGFPSESPVIVWKTPIFHPNFREDSICLGNHWTAGTTLAELCVTICEMVQYKQFNYHDPLNRSAAEWLDYALENNPDQFPVDNRIIRDLNFDIEPVEQREIREHGENRDQANL